MNWFLVSSLIGSIALAQSVLKPVPEPLDTVACEMGAVPNIVYLKSGIIGEDSSAIHEIQRQIGSTVPVQIPALQGGTLVQVDAWLELAKSAAKESGAAAAKKVDDILSLMQRGRTVTTLQDVFQIEEGAPSTAEGWYQQYLNKLDLSRLIDQFTNSIRDSKGLLVISYQQSSLVSNALCDELKKDGSLAEHFHRGNPFHAIQIATFSDTNHCGNKWVTNSGDEIVFWHRLSWDFRDWGIDKLNETFKKKVKDYVKKQQADSPDSGAKELWNKVSNWNVLSQDNAGNQVSDAMKATIVARIKASLPERPAESNTYGLGSTLNEYMAPGTDSRKTINQYLAEAKQILMKPTAGLAMSLPHAKPLMQTMSREEVLEFVVDEQGRTNLSCNSIAPGTYSFEIQKPGLDRPVTLAALGVVMRDKTFPSGDAVFSVTVNLEPTTQKYRASFNLAPDPTFLGNPLAKIQNGGYNIGSMLMGLLSSNFFKVLLAIWVFRSLVWKNLRKKS